MGFDFWSYPRPQGRKKGNYSEIYFAHGGALQLSKFLSPALKGRVDTSPGCSGEKGGNERSVPSPPQGSPRRSWFALRLGVVCTVIDLNRSLPYFTPLNLARRLTRLWRFFKELWEGNGTSKSLTITFLFLPE